MNREDELRVALVRLEFLSQPGDMHVHGASGNGRIIAPDLVMNGKVEAGGPVGKYAYGFGDKVFSGRHIVGHNGGSPGIGANFDMFPELGYTAIILTNYDPPAMMPVIMKIRELLGRG